MYYTLLHLARLETTCGWSSRINIIKLINADEIVPPPKPPKVGMSPASWIRCHTHVEGVPWWSCEHLPDLGTSWWKEQNAEQKLKDKKRPEDAHIYIYTRGAWGSPMETGGVGWGGVGISTSWRPRPWYYVVSIYARLRMQHVTTLTLRWGGVGWGGDINVLTTTSLILRCQHICSLEDATCHYDTLAPWVFINKLFICIYLYIHIRIYRDICLYVHMYFYCNMFIHRWNDTNVLRSRDIYMGINIFIHMVIHDIYVLW